MSNLAPVNQVSAELIEKVVVQGDLSKLSPGQRTDYYAKVCSSLGLNPLTKPFDYINLNGKLTLYAKRDATDQLRSIHKISINISDRQRIEDVYIVTAKAKNSEGREDESTGAVSIAGLKGDNLANAMMKAETKAKRRVTLSICGLGLLDESELETIPDAKPAAVPQVNPLKEAKRSTAVAEEDPGEYVVTFGKFGPKKDGTPGLKIKDIDMFDLDSYVKFIQTEAERGDKPIKGQVAQFMTAATLYLNMRDVKSQGFEDVDFDSAYDAAKAAP